MIAHLKGRIIDIYKEKIVLDVNGVGYLVGVLGEGHLVGEDVELYIHTAVRENDISLWGFRALPELQLFEMLLGVSGVGLKTAQSILSSLGINRVVQAIISEDPQQLKVPGVGAKTSERIILDMKGKLDVSEFDVSRSEGAAVVSENRQQVEDAIIAMESLGYRRAEVEAALKRLKLSDYSQASDLVKAILVNI